MVFTPMLSTGLSKVALPLAAQVRLLVSAQGVPVQVLLQQSTGFARLDEQALAAMRQAQESEQQSEQQPYEIF